MKETCERVQFKLTHPLGDRDSRREELMNQRKKEFGEKADARHKARAAAKDGDASDKVIRPSVGRKHISSPRHMEGAPAGATAAFEHQGWSQDRPAHLGILPMAPVGCENVHTL